MLAMKEHTFLSAGLAAVDAFFGCNLITEAFLAKPRVEKV